MFSKKSNLLLSSRFMGCLTYEGAFGFKLFVLKTYPQTMFCRQISNMLVNKLDEPLKESFSMYYQN